MLIMRIIKTYLCHFTGHLKKFETFKTSKIFENFILKNPEYYDIHVLLSIISTPDLQS